MKNELICIVCPIGCRLTVIKENDTYKVVNNQCIRGQEYAIKESTFPTRVITSTVKVINNTKKRLPIKTDKAISKDLIFDVMKLINNIEVEAPIKLGDVLVKNILGTDVNIVASKSL